MTASIHYSWKPYDNGQTYRRFAQGIEASNAVNSKFDGLWSMYSSITISSKKSVDEIVDRLKNAWVQLRFEAPIIAVKVEPSPDLGQQYHQFVYQIQKGEGIQAWLKTSFHILPPMTKEEAHDQIISERAKLAYGQFSGNLYFVPLLAESNVYRLVFATPHATTDVRGSMSVFHRLLELASSSDETVSQQEWGQEVLRLYPPLVYAAGLRYDGDRPPVDLEQLLQDASATQAASDPTALLKHKSDAIPYSTSPLPIMTSLVLQKHTHDNITQIGRKNGTSVTGIFAGILAMLASRYNQVPQARSVSIWGVATDRRARIPERYKPFYSQAIWSKSIRLTNMNEIRAAERAMLEDGHVTNEFWNICHEFKQDLDIFAKDDISLAMSNDLVMTGLQSKGVTFENVPPAHCFYSSYGKYDNTVQHDYGSNEHRIEVDDPHCMALCHNLPVVAFSTSSWKGKLTVFSQHSRNYYEEQDVKAFYADMQKCFNAIAASA